MKYKPTTRGTIAVIIIFIGLLIAGYIEVKADTIVVLPSSSDDGHTDSKTIITPTDNGGQKMIHCLSSDTGLIYCIEL